MLLMQRTLAGAVHHVAGGGAVALAGHLHLAIGEQLDITGEDNRVVPE